MGTCMIPCEDNTDCLFEGTACHHSHCLFPCNDDDADCAQWPGFTCQHGGNSFCEND